MNSVEFPAVLVAAVAGLSAGLAVVALMKGKIKKKKKEKKMNIDKTI